MEQNADAGVPVAPMVENKQKSGNGLKIATAIACVVAVCGIGFGAYGMIQSAQKDSQISDLKVQIKEDDGTITTIETPEIETATNGETTVTITDSIAQNTEDYIYVGEWGMKIKIPEELRVANYLFQTHKWGKEEGGNEEISVTGINKDVDRLPNFAVLYGENLGCMGLGSIMKTLKGNGISVEPDETKEGWPSKIIFSDDSSDYWYVREPLCSINEEEKNLEKETRSVIEKMLLDPNSYSKI